MNWFYVDAGQQAGPVPDEQLDELVRNGKVRGDTLVWRDGMPNWQAYSQARPEGVQPPAPVLTPPVPGVTPIPPGIAPTGNEVVCAECLQTFPRSATIQYGNVWVCQNCRPRFVQRLQSGAPLAPGAVAGMFYAGFWIRFLAKLIDGLIVGVIFGIPIFIVMFPAVLSGNPPQGQPAWASGFFAWPLQLMSWIIMLLYNGIFIGRFGATPGKMALGLKVVSPEGAPISYGRSFGRAAAEILSGLICNIGYIIAAFDSQKRALHDHIATTRVIRTRF